MAGDIEQMEELQVHMSMGNYYYLTQLTDQPHVVACFLKKVLRCMGEPLCTYELYHYFRGLSGNIPISY
jgi:RhoGAP domain